MRIILALLGVFWIVAGFLIFIFTDASREILRNILKKKNLLLFSALAFIVGILFIFGAGVVSIPWLAILIGFLAMLKGFFFALAPEKKVMGFIDWWLNASNAAYRSWAVVAFLFGILILLILKV